MNINFNKEYKNFFNHSKIFEQLIQSKLGNEPLYEMLLDIMGEEHLKVIVISSLETIIQNANNIPFYNFSDNSLFSLINEEVNSPEIFMIKNEYTGDKLTYVKKIKKAVNLYFISDLDANTELANEITNWPQVQKLLNLANELDDNLPVKSENKKNKI